MRGYHQLGEAVRFRVFSGFLVLLAHPNQARCLLRERANNSHKQTPGFAALRDLLRDGLLTSQGEHWLRQRRIAQPAFHQFRIAKFGNTMTHATNTLVDNWFHTYPETVNATTDMVT